MLELLDNLDYSDRLFPAPPPSALAGEIAERFFEILCRFDMSSGEVIYDQLLYLSLVTNYPNKQASKHIYPRLNSISDDDLDMTDYLLSITIDKKKNSTGCACVVVCLKWLLDKDENKSPITVILKSIGLNTTYGGIQTKNLLKELDLA